MLVENYYKVLSRRKEGEKELFEMSLLPECKVYEGHFPGQPVSPGVCNIQMVKECAEQIAGRELVLNYVQQCRLTTLVTPTVHAQVEVAVELTPTSDSAYRFRATIGRGEDIYLDIKGELNAK